MDNPLPDHQGWTTVMRRAAGNYFYTQGTVGLIWWTFMIGYPLCRTWFIPTWAAERLTLPLALPDLLLFCGGSFTAGYACRSNHAAGETALVISAVTSYATLLCWGMSLESGEGWLGTAAMSAALSTCIISTIMTCNASFFPSQLRKTSSTTPAAVTLRTAIHITVFWTVLLFLLPAGIHALEQRAGVPVTEVSSSTRWLAVIIFVAAGSLGLTSALWFIRYGRGTPLPIDSTHELVIDGPYRFIRNPMAVAGLTQGLAVALWHGSAAVLVYVILGGLVWHIILRPLEEHDLLLRFGNEYDLYRQRVWCWVPTLPPRTTQS